MVSKYAKNEGATRQLIGVAAATFSHDNYRDEEKK